MRITTKVLGKRRLKYFRISLGSAQQVGCLLMTIVAESMHSSFFLFGHKYAGSSIFLERIVVVPTDEAAQQVSHVMGFA